MSEEFREGLKKSLAIVGPIYPVIVDKQTMEIVDGRHRKRVNPQWPELEKEFPDRKSKILFRIHANYRRSISRAETQTNLLMLAAILEKEGVPKEQIASKLAEITPYSLGYVERLMPKKYKQSKFSPRKVDLGRPTKIVSSSPKKRDETRASDGSESATSQQAPRSISGSAGQGGQSESIREPVKKPKKTVTCPHCHVELTKVLCVECWREIPIKDLRRMLTE